MIYLTYIHSCGKITMFNGKTHHKWPCSIAAHPWRHAVQICRSASGSRHQGCAKTTVWRWNISSNPVAWQPDDWVDCVLFYWPWVKTYCAIFGWLFTSINPIYFDVDHFFVPRCHAPGLCFFHMFWAIRNQKLRKSCVRRVFQASALHPCLLDAVWRCFVSSNSHNIVASEKSKEKLEA